MSAFCERLQTGNYTVRHCNKRLKSTSGFGMFVRYVLQETF